MKTTLWLLGGGVIGLPLLGWLIIFLGMKFSPNPTKPKITYGEFPFKLVYEINGEQKTIEDTLICEFDGFGWNEATGKFRKWKSHLSSESNISTTKIELIKDSDNNAFICYSLGYPEYYMDAIERDVNIYNPYPRFYETLKGSTVSTEDLLEKYNIKITTWEHAQPIVNKFV